MVKVGLVRELTVHAVKGEIEGATPIFSQDGVLLRLRATQTQADIPDIPPLRGGEAVVFLLDEQADGLVQTLEEALRSLRNSTRRGPDP